MKKHFTDGLLQLAIVLSLLRTDLNNYFNNFHNYPEVQDIILGSSSAYVQSQNYHNNRWNREDGYSHPKQLENYQSSVFRELHSLSDIRRFDGLDTMISAWLVNHGPASLLMPDESIPNAQPATQSGDIGTDNGQNMPTAELPEGAVGPPQSSDLHTFRPPEDELSKEDMDLIDILWRQDMDLGVCREVYDPNLRQNLEKEQELALKKQKELDEFDVKKEAENDNQPQSDISFIVDGETGELVPLVIPPQPPQRPAQLDETDEGLSMEEAMLFLEEQQRKDEEEAGGILSSPIPADVMVAAPTQKEISDAEVGREIEAFIQNAQQILEQQQQQQQQQQQLDVIQMQSSHATQPVFSTQDSLEAALDEVVSLLDMPSMDDASQPTGNAGQMLESVSPYINDNNSMNNVTDMNANILDNNTDSPLISNTTMTAYNPEYNVLQHQPVQSGADNMTLADSLAQLSPLTNATLGLPGVDNSIYNFTQDMNMFTNITSLTGTGQLNDTDFQHTHSLLRQLMEDDPLEELMDTHTPVHSIIEGQHHKSQEDAVSSDSAVSSMGSCSPLGDMNNAFSTLSEGLEGATGGMEYDTKFEAKYSPYPESTGLADFDDLNGGNSMNCSGSPNGSDPSGSSSNLGDMRRYVKHNHTYPLQPGQQPKESKSKLSKHERKLSFSRDERRAKELKVPFTTEEIIHSPVERFNEMLQKYHLTEAQLQLIRDIRRRGKNKVAAQNCRKRKIEALSTIDEDIDDLKKHRDKLVNERGLINKELKEFKDKMSQLYSEVFASLRDDEGRPYDPSQYSLQQTADGSIILVPRNAASGDSTDDKTSRRRKGKKN